MEKSHAMEKRRRDGTGPGAPAPASPVSHARMHLAPHRLGLADLWLVSPTVNTPSGVLRMTAGERNDVFPGARLVDPITR